MRSGSGDRARMYLSTLLVLAFIGGNLCMDCSNQKATFATCYIDSDYGLKGTIDFAQTAPLGCFGPRDPIEIMVSLTGFNETDDITQHGLIVKTYGDISENCAANDPIFRVPDDPNITGFLGNYQEGTKAAFKVQSNAKLRDQHSIIGRSLVVLQGPYSSGYNPLGCCVIALSTGTRFAGMPKPAHRPAPHATQPRSDFGFKSPSVHDSAIRSPSFFRTSHPFETSAPKSLPFTSHDDPKQATGDFVFDLKNLHNIGSANFGSPNFGFDSGFSGPSKLRPSIANINKPPSPPKFPGSVHTGGSPLFGDFGGHSDVGKDFGFDLNSIGLSESEKYIPRDGEQTHAPGYEDQGHSGSDPHSDRGHSQDGGYDPNSGHQGSSDNSYDPNDNRAPAHRPDHQSEHPAYNDQGSQQGGHPDNNQNEPYHEDPHRSSTDPHASSDPHQGHASQGQDPSYEETNPNHRQPDPHAAAHDSNQAYPDSSHSSYDPKQGHQDPHASLNDQYPSQPDPHAAAYDSNPGHTDPHPSSNDPHQNQPDPHASSYDPNQVHPDPHAPSNDQYQSQPDTHASSYDPNQVHPDPHAPSNDQYQSQPDPHASSYDPNQVHPDPHASSNDQYPSQPDPHAAAYDPNQVHPDPRASSNVPRQSPSDPHASSYVPHNGQPDPHAPSYDPHQTYPSTNDQSQGSYPNAHVPAIDPHHGTHVDPVPIHAPVNLPSDNKPTHPQPTPAVTDTKLYQPSENAPVSTNEVYHPHPQTNIHPTLPVPTPRTYNQELHPLPTPDAKPLEPYAVPLPNDNNLYHPNHPILPGPTPDSYIPNPHLVPHPPESYVLPDNQQAPIGSYPVPPHPNSYNPVQPTLPSPTQNSYPVDGSYNNGPSGGYDAPQVYDPTQQGTQYQSPPVPKQGSTYSGPDVVEPKTYDVPRLPGAHEAYVPPIVNPTASTNNDGNTYHTTTPAPSG